MVTIVAKRRGICTLMLLVVAALMAAQVLGQPPLPFPRAMTLNADPGIICTNGDTSILTATVYNTTNYTEPIQNVVVRFRTSLGSITNSSYGGNVAPDECWTWSNSTGVAVAILTAGAESGTANVTVWVGDESAPCIETVIPVEFRACSGLTVTLRSEHSRIEPGKISEIVALVEEDENPVVNANITFETDLGYFTETLNTLSTTKTNASGVAVAHFSADANGTAHITAIESETGVAKTVTVAVGLSHTGDVDGDGGLTFDDVILLAKHYYFGDTIFDNPDVTGDGVVTFEDVILLAKHYYFGDPIYP